MKILPLFIIAFAVAAVAQSRCAAESGPGATPRRPNPVLAPIIDVPGLPRVLLIGDSISMGYTLGVREKLAGRANVHRPPQNCGDTKRGLENLDAWLGRGRWDVIHFNFGLHDLKYLDAAGKYVPPDQGKQVADPSEYARNLEALVARLERTGAKLIFATTTPVPSGTTGRVAGDEIVYNATARRVMDAHGIPINDLHGLVAPRLEEFQRPRNVHFKPEGSAHMADAVVEWVTKFLPGPDFTRAP